MRLVHPQPHEERTDPADYFTGGDGLNVPKLAVPIRDAGHIRLGIDGRLYRYSTGVYLPDGESFVRLLVRERLSGMASRIP